MDCTACKEPEEAAWANHIDCMMRLREAGHKLTARLTDIPVHVSKGDCMPMLRYLHEVAGVPWAAKATAEAARVGKFHALEYMHSHGAPLADYIINSAINGVSLECMKYAHTHGAPWSSNSVGGAMTVKSRDLLQYAVTHGAPYDINQLIKKLADMFMYSYDDAVPFSVDMLEYFFSLFKDDSLYDVLFEKSIRCIITTMYGRYERVILRGMDHTYAVQVNDFCDYPFVRKFLQRVKQLLAAQDLGDFTEIFPLTSKLLAKADEKLNKIQELVMETSQLPLDVVVHEVMKFMV